MEGDPATPDSPHDPPGPPATRPAGKGESGRPESPVPRRVGPYEVLGLLGRGGMGMVLRARDPRLGREVAIKALPPELASQPEMRSRFEREARTLAALDHPNLVSIYGIEEAEGASYLILPLLAGEALSDRIARGVAPVEESLRICAQIAAGLEAAHGKGIVHRDLKPGNVHVTPSGLVKVLDFGLARRVASPAAEGRSEASSLTGSGVAMGTPGYMSPEQARGEEVDARADVWAFGCVLFECLTGKGVFGGRTPADRLVAALEREPAWESLSGEVPARIEALLERCLEKEPGKRLSSIAEARLEIEGVLEGEAVAPSGGARRGKARGNLPHPATSFFGREGEIGEIGRLLGEGRLLTLSGTGGSGKTRLAIEAARRLRESDRDRWPGGVWFADLTEARSVEGIVTAVAGALDVPLGKGDPVVQLGHAIAGRGPCLVILDNFEQVAGHAPGTVGKWVERGADARFLVTSRERLLVPGEQVLPVEPLPPEGAGVELFVARAKAQRPDFALSEANAAPVREVVRLLDGLPLAIELAAARVRALSPAQLLEKMRDRFKVLAGGRGVPEKQATMRAAIDWSWGLLAPWEQAALAQASVFVGGFTLEAAEAVLDLSAWPEAPLAMDAVQALVDKSLLRTWVPSHGERRHEIEEPHFGMYVSVHEYASEKLRLWEEQHPEAHGGGPEPARGETELRAAEIRHGRYFAQFGSQEAIASLDTHGGVARRQALSLEIENLVAACRRATARGDGPIAVPALWAAWGVLGFKGPFLLAVDLGEQVLGIEALASTGRARALRVFALALWRAGRTGEAQATCAEALALARAAGDRRSESALLGNLGVLSAIRGRSDEALALYEEAMAIARAAGDRHLEGTVQANLASLHKDRGRGKDALRGYRDVIAIAREVGDRDMEGVALSNLGELHRLEARTHEALQAYAEAIAIAVEVGNRRSEGIVLGNMGILHRRDGRKQEAMDCCERAIAIHREVGNRALEGIALGNLGNLHYDQGRLDKALPCYEEALASHRETRNRSAEGVVLASLGHLHCLEGRMEEAERCFREAGGIHREAGDRRNEGVSLGEMGGLYFHLGRPSEAREAFAAGETLLREVRDPYRLAILLCVRAKWERLAGDTVVARRDLEEAESISREIGAGPEGELVRLLSELRGKLSED